MSGGEAPRCHVVWHLYVSHVSPIPRCGCGERAKCGSLCGASARLNVAICLILIALPDVASICAIYLDNLRRRAHFALFSMLFSFTGTGKDFRFRDIFVTSRPLLRDFFRDTPTRRFSWLPRYFSWDTQTDAALRMWRTGKSRTRIAQTAVSLHGMHARDCHRPLPSLNGLCHHLGLIALPSLRVDGLAIT